MQEVSNLAVIEEGAQLGSNVTIEPFAVIKKNVTIGDNVCVKSHAYLDGNTVIGDNSTIWPYTTIGTQTQHMKYNNETTYVEIGSHCHIREHVVINASWGKNSKVVVGDNCLIMGACHIAHNCQIGNDVILTNNVLLGGHVTIGDNSIIGGMTAIHQFCNIGKFVMVGGMSGIMHDVPPYTLGAGNPFAVRTVNRIGLKRNGFSLETRTAIHKALTLTYHSGYSTTKALELLAELDEIPEVAEWIDFCRKSKRGIKGMQTKLAESVI